MSIPSILGISPFEKPDAGLVVALARAGALGVLDLGRDVRAAEEAMAKVALLVPRFGVRIPEYVAVDPASLPAEVKVVVLSPGVSRRDVAKNWGDRTVLAQITSLAEARAAAADGAHGLIVKGSEAGGRVGAETSFVLLQRVLKEVSLPTWVQGGIGVHGAAACIAAGARGVVLDAQLALLEEASPASVDVARALSMMDGSETAIVADHRVYSRPSLPPPPMNASAQEVTAKFGAASLTTELLAAGQDAAFARPFADRYRTVRGVVRAVREAMTGHLKLARALQPLGPRSAFARAHQIEVPIAQGPMTRVSDRASFAGAVADAGGLPFVALSLMRSNEARQLLQETAALLAGRTWGVGILGFLPAELREEQLALLLETRPPVALIAGGRPSQARPLEEAGIATYLHVPSPGLLDLFLKDGARRFVFEGRECGGHVGPRSSFVLWEMAIERLLACEDVRDVSVLFAGGIHDARSAAMVSAMAAPLAARGAKVGVLMGTAYLFTEEAVTCGAIQPVFQEEAMRCEDTVLLETAPGHSTRCADSEYVRAFRRERIRLEGLGLEAQAMWEALEQLNLGRLRVASKGLRREGDRLVAVDALGQRQEGMFMIGQVAALRSARCTMAELHADVAAGSVAHLEAALLPEVSLPKAKPLDIAIIGMSCIFPDAPDLSSYWKNITLGKNAIREVPAERWNKELYYEAGGTGEKTPSKWGGFLPDVVFDPTAHGIPPRSLAAIDPAQLLSLEVAKRALVDAGYGDREFDREHTSVIFGAQSGTDLASAYGFRASFPQYLGALPEELDAHLPKLTEDSFPGVLANVIAGRIANRLDLGGVNYTVDAACASSLAALDIACKELASGTSDMVISGGADLHNGINDYLLFASVHALSPTGQCRTFDAAADGIALGEGVAAVVLKRLADAERDGDRVYAVIKGVGGSSDGKSLGLTAPRKEGQVRALERAYERAGVSPADVGLVEAHGTGTVVGDRTELSALSDFFGSAGALPGACTLGSVKSQIGHTKCSAGLAGIIKAALAIHHRVLPPTKNVTKPNSAYDAATSPFVFRDASIPWISDSRKAGVSAFGFGGTNFHVVLEGHADACTTGSNAWPAELFIFRGQDKRAIAESLAALEKALDSRTELRLSDLARSVAASDGAGPVQLAIVAESVEDLRAKLEAARSGKASPEVHVADPAASFSAESVAFIFPGQGSQRPGMLRDLFVAFPELDDLVVRGARFTDRLFPSAAFSLEERTAQDHAVRDTRVAQPVLGIAGLAMARVLGRAGIRPAMAAGHSYGELVALTVAGAISEADLLALSEARASSILDAAGENPGTMAAVRASAAKVTEALAGMEGITLANHNAPDQCVIAGSDAAVDAACKRLSAHNLSARTIPVACAFHSPIVAGASTAFARTLGKLELGAPRIPVFSNTTAEAYPLEAPAIRAQLAAQLASPVRFAEEVEAMYAAGARVFVEAGPGGVLTDLVGRILGARSHLAISCDRSGTHGINAYLSALAQLAVGGVEVDVSSLFHGRDARVIDLSAPASKAPLWIVNGQTARPIEGELPDFAMRLVTTPFTLTAPAVAAPVDDRDAVILEYMRNMRELVEGQRQVMLRYLGESSVERQIVDAPANSVRAERSIVTAAQGKVRSVEKPLLPAVALKPLEALIATVSDRTGYPPEMLDLDLDLEADLGIDSIKRIEILGTMSEKLGLKLHGAGKQSEAIEALAGVKTLRGIATWLDTRLAGGTPAPDAVLPPKVEAVAAPAVSFEVLRYVLEVSPVPAAVPNGVSVRGRRFAITEDRHGVATKLAALLHASGAHTRIVAKGDELGAGSIDGLLHLDSISSESTTSVKSLFSLAKEAVLADATWIVAATGLGGRFGHQGDGELTSGVHGGVAGLMKTVAKEWPALRVKAVDLHPHGNPTELAEHIYAELIADDHRVEVGYSGSIRQTLSVVPRASAAVDASVPPLVIDRSSVVLMTGGARGITAEVAVAMAKRFQCHLELVGRSPAPSGEEDPELRGAANASALRKLLLARTKSVTTPAAIDALCNNILRDREIRATFAAIRAAGGTFAYHALDVRETAAFGALIDDIYARRGRLDGVVHGAGLLEDKLLRHKTNDSFGRVFDTKVASALVLSEKLRSDAQFVVFFSSVSGAFGNKGQVDYAAANNALDTLAHHLQKKLSARVLSINWGPWGGVGMVRPELEREYAKRGVGLIGPEEGVARFFDELCIQRDAQVILMASSLESFTRGDA